MALGSRHSVCIEPVTDGGPLAPPHTYLKVEFEMHAGIAEMALADGMFQRLKKQTRRAPYGRLCSCADMALHNLRLAIVTGQCRCLSKSSSRSLLPSPHGRHMAFPYGRLCSCADMALRSLRLSFVMGWCRCLSKDSSRSLPPSPTGPYGRPPVRSTYSA